MVEALLLLPDIFGTSYAGGNSGVGICCPGSLVAARNVSHSTEFNGYDYSYIEVDGAGGKGNCIRGGGTLIVYALSIDGTGSYEAKGRGFEGSYNGRYYVSVASGGGSINLFAKEIITENIKNLLNVSGGETSVYKAKGGNGSASVRNN